MSSRVNKVADSKHNISTALFRGVDFDSISVKGQSINTARKVQKFNRFINSELSRPFVRFVSRSERDRRTIDRTGPGRRGFPRTFANPRSININQRNTASKMSTFRRRRTFSRKRKRTSSAISVANLALRKVRKLQRKTEVKYADIGLVTIASISTSGDVTAFSNVGQGDGVGQRDGDAISPFMLELNFQWFGTALAVTELYRTIIFIDRRQVESTTPSVATVLKSLDALSTIKGSVRTRFTILYDEMFTRPSANDVHQSFARSLRIKLNMQMRYKGVVSTDIVKNGLYMLNISNSTGNLPSFNFHSRLLYND